uniref:Uncharacterized protein n=1 Tax=Onchocerca volvulus TaxID=6282 RepID=A0A8R1U0P5_ONCVO
MFTLSVFATLFAAVTVDSLILYYPAYPQYVVSKHLRNFERNAPPEIFAKDPNIPSSGIVFLKKKNLRESLSNLQDESDLKKSSNQQKLHSDRSDAKLRKVETVHETGITTNSTNKSSTLSPSPVKSAQVQVTTSPAAGVSSITLQQSNSNPLRYFVVFDSKSKQFTTSNESKFSKFNEKNNEPVSKKPLTPQSTQYYEGTAQLIPHENNTKAVLLGRLDEFGSDERLESIADIPVYIIDSDAIVKPLDLLFLNG